MVAGLLVMMVAVTAAVVVMQEGQRKIPVQYAKRVVGPADVRGPVHAHPAADQHRRRDPGHLRLVADPVPGDLTRFIQHPWMQYVLGGAVARAPHLHRAVHAR